MTKLVRTCKLRFKLHIYCFVLKTRQQFFVWILHFLLYSIVTTMVTNTCFVTFYSSDLIYIQCRQFILRFYDHTFKFMFFTLLFSNLLFKTIFSNILTILFFAHYWCLHFICSMFMAIIIIF